MMTIEILEPTILHEWLREGKPIVLIDVLVDEHFTAVRLPTAVNVCVYEIVFLENIAKLIPDKDQEIVVYGSGEKSLEAQTASEKLINVGYRNVRMLQGGLNGWKAMGYKIEGEDLAVLERVEQALPLVDGRYVVDTNQSIIHWFGRNKNTIHRGTLSLSGGELIFNNGEPKGSFEIDMTSIKNIDLEGDPLQPQLVAHLKSEDFFFTRMFPKASFTITSAKQVEEVPSSLHNFSVRGFFELRGMKNDIAFLATASSLQDGEVKIEAHFDIDRTRWGVLYGSSEFFEHLGYHLVYNPISIQICLLARIKIGPPTVIPD
jgi:rhodanese-related sulfurtransferase/polyisoprenoid-binding protein YceI